MIIHHKLFLVLLLVMLLAGCASSSPASPTLPSTNTPPATTEPAPLAASITAPVPNDTLTPVPYQPMEASIVLDNFFLRAGPGFQFETIGAYLLNQKVSVLGRAPGGFWLKVRADDGAEGWMRVDGLKLAGTKYDAPEIEPAEGIVLRGHVYASNGSPAAAITVMINPENAPDTKLQDVAETDFLGQYYFFLPEGLSGNWVVEANGWRCKGNNVTPSCNLIGKFPPPVLISLPGAASEWIDLQLLP